MRKEYWERQMKERITNMAERDERRTEGRKGRKERKVRTKDNRKYGKKRSSRMKGTRFTNRIHDPQCKEKEEEEEECIMAGRE